MIEATFGLLQFILILYLAMSLASILTLMSKYKNYKETYLLLSEYILVENSKKYILLASKEEIDRISGINTDYIYYLVLIIIDIIFSGGSGIHL